MTTAAQVTPDPHADLQRSISDARFQTFLDAAADDAKLARDLYVWNRDVSVGLLADIAVIEVALRNAMHDAAKNAWHSHWYADPEVPLDDRSSSQLAGAWGLLHTSIKNRAEDADVPGRIIAQCTFGFWTNLLDAGGYVGRPPRRHEADYDYLWKRAFKKAFPGGRIEAKRQRDAQIAALAPGPSRQQEVLRLRQEVAFTRVWVHRICKNVNELRNRVAHHEPIVNGFPLKGQHQRMTTQEGFDEILALARMIDMPLATWINSNSTVPALLAHRPS